MSALGSQVVLDLWFARQARLQGIGGAALVFETRWRCSANRSPSPCTLEDAGPFFDRPRLPPAGRRRRQRPAATLTSRRRRTSIRQLRRSRRHRPGQSAGPVTVLSRDRLFATTLPAQVGAATSFSRGRRRPTPPTSVFRLVSHAPGSLTAGEEERGDVGAPVADAARRVGVVAGRGRVHQRGAYAADAVESVAVDGGRASAPWRSCRCRRAVAAAAADRRGLDRHRAVGATRHQVLP